MKKQSNLLFGKLSSQLLNTKTNIMGKTITEKIQMSFWFCSLFWQANLEKVAAIKS